MSHDDRQSSQIAVSVSEETLKRALSFVDIRLLLPAMDVDNKDELVQKMEHVEDNLSAALDTLQRNPKMGEGFAHLETERRSIVVDSDVPDCIEEILDAYFEHVGIYETPAQWRDDLGPKLGNLLPNQTISQ